MTNRTCLLISKKFMNTIINEKNASNLEKGIFNYTLKECEKRNIAKNWTNIYGLKSPRPATSVQCQYNTDRTPTDTSGTNKIAPKRPDAYSPITMQHNAINAIVIGIRSQTSVALSGDK